MTSTAAKDYGTTTILLPKSASKMKESSKMNVCFDLTCYFALNKAYPLSCPSNVLPQNKKFNNKLRAREPVDN